jgi:hypothetical protein
MERGGSKPYEALKGINLYPLTKMRLICERDAENRTGTMRFIGACCIRKRLLAEHRSDASKSP